MSRSRKRMAIISSYLPRESYGLLGPQMAAGTIEENTEYECIVIAVTREDDKNQLKKALADYFSSEMPIVGFSMLSGRIRVQQVRIWVLGRTPQAFTSVSGTPTANIHTYRRPALSNSPAGRGRRQAPAGPARIDVQRPEHEPQPLQPRAEMKSAP